MTRRVTPLDADHSHPTCPTSSTATTTAVTTTTTSESTSLIYEATLLDPLPVVDLSRTLLTKCLSPSTEHRVVTFIAARIHHLVKLFRLGMISFVVSFFYDTQAFRSYMLVMAFLASAAHLCALLLLPLDLVALLLRNYEFWFVTVFNVAHWIVMGIILDDARAVMCVPAFLGYQLAILIDANIRLSQATVSTMKISIPFLLITGAMVSLRHVEGMNHFAVVVHGQERFDASDVLNATTSTLLVFLIKILVKKKMRARPGPPGFNVMSCAVLSATLQLVRTEVAIPPAELIHIQRRRSLVSLRRSDPLECHQQPLTIHNFPVYHLDPLHLVMSPRWWRHDCRWRRLLRFVFYAVGFVGYAMLGVHVMTNTPSKPLPVANSAALIAAPCIILLCTISILLSQRELLWIVLTNFDFLFSSAQVVMFAVSLCDLMWWDFSRSLVVFSWMLLFHWAIALDVLTPVIKQDILRFSKRWATPTLVVLVVLGFLVFSRLVLSTNTDVYYHDRTLWSHRVSDSQVISLRTKSVLLGRILTLVLWTTRKVYLMLMRHENELNIVRGSVEYLSPFAAFPIAKGTFVSSEHAPRLYLRVDSTEGTGAATRPSDTSKPSHTGLSASGEGHPQCTPCNATEKRSEDNVRNSMGVWCSTRAAFTED